MKKACNDWCLEQTPTNPPPNPSISQKHSEKVTCPKCLGQHNITWEAVVVFGGSEWVVIPG